jgi:hypothetical protein
LTKGEIKYGKEALQIGIQRVRFSDTPSDAEATGAYSCKGSEQMERKEGEIPRVRIADKRETP